MVNATSYSGSFKSHVMYHRMQPIHEIQDNLEKHVNEGLFLCL